MAIITTAEVKTLLSLTGSVYDTAIAALIPYVQADLCEYLNTYFQDGYVYRKSGSALVITRGATSSGTTQADKMTDADALFIAKGFLSGMDVAIEGGYSNVGIHSIASLDASTMKFTSTGTLISQDPNSTLDNNYIGTLLISRVNWPRGIKRVVAQIIWYNIQRQKETGVQSESIDDYSVTYAPLSSGGYPPHIVSALATYRKVRMH